MEKGTDMNHTCGLCHGFGVIKEYEDEWPCPSCRPHRTFKIVTGLIFEDWDGNECASYQMVCDDDGRAYATADFRGETCERYLCADSAVEKGEEFRKLVSHLARHPKGLDKRDVHQAIEGFE